MKVTVPLALVLILATAVGYLVGTESGRQRRDFVLAKLGRTRAEIDGEDAASEAGENGE